MKDQEFIELGCGLDTPGTPTAGDAPKKSYPCFYFTCDEPIDLPGGDFTFTAKGRKVSATNNTRDPENPRHSYEIEVHGFKPMGAKGPNVDVGSSIKKAMREKMADKANEYGESAE